MSLLPKTGYRAKIMKVAKLRPGHPVNMGVSMQAHHLVSAEGVGGGSTKNKLERLGYDINDLDNLVLIPSSLQGACHMQVQLHRGNHTHVDDPGDSADDDDHPDSYHDKVKRLLDGIIDDIKDGDFCGPSGKKKVQEDVDDISDEMMKKIKKFKIPLTERYKDYKPGGPGCRGKDSVPDARSSSDSCAVNRDHQKRTDYTPQGPGQRKFDITYKAGEYNLKVGR